LREDGYHFVGPADGWQSCRERGVGRMAEPTEIAAEVRRLLEQLKPTK
jgi:phosphopantothenoylcysteine synthetase/decarboxylase